ncbi:MAG: fasciclin domain-containing protein [Alphaproteobacteria bacterium]
MSTLVAACSTATPPTAATTPKAPPPNTIVDVAAGAGTFKTLLTAAQAAGLVDTLKSPGPLTVFAPTDDAFAKLPKGTVENLLKPENKETLARILKHHVVPGKVMAADIAGKRLNADTAAGTKLPIDARRGVIVGGAKVTTADIPASNGVIHVVDKVILPPK